MAKKAAARESKSRSIRNTRFSLRSRRSSSNSPVVRPGLLPSSISAWAIQRRKPDSEIPSSEAIRATGFDPSRANSTALLRNSAGIGAGISASPLLRPFQAPHDTCPQKRGKIIASHHLTHTQIYDALHVAAEKNGLLAEDGDRNITQTITDGIIKGIGDGPDREHREPAERNPYILTPPEAVEGEGAEGDGIHQLDLGKVVTAEFDDDQWLIEPIIPANRSVALYAAGKTGKSLLVLDFVAAAASGRSILGGAPLETPIHILYVDQEMTQPDLQERLHDLGYAQPDSTLTTLAQYLHYYQLSPWPPLDTPAGGQRLLKEALNVKAQLVVIDTLIRTISGEENSADTIKDFSRYTAMPLKAAGIALLRIDHVGKDLTRGQRGTSAKRDDVDVVWLLVLALGGLPGKTMLTLKREATRVDWIQQDVHITRNEGPPLQPAPMGHRPVHLRTAGASRATTSSEWC